MYDFKNIVVGLEIDAGSESVAVGSAKAARQALWVARVSKGRIVFVHSTFSERYHDAEFGDLALAAPQATPPETLWARLRRETRRSPAGFLGRRMGLVSAGLAVAIVGALGGWNMTLAGRLSEAETHQRWLVDALGTLGNPETGLVPLEGEMQGRVSILLSPDSRGMYLVALVLFLSAAATDAARHVAKAMANVRLFMRSPPMTSRRATRPGSDQPQIEVQPGCHTLTRLRPLRLA